MGNRNREDQPGVHSEQLSPDRHGYGSQMGPVGLLLQPEFSIEKKISKSGSVVMLRVTRRVDERNGSLFRCCHNWRPCIGVPIELSKIMTAKLVPLRWISVKSLAQLIARGNIFQPAIDSQGFFGHSARPETIDKEPSAILARRFFVCALVLNHF